jgi:flagellar hook assembly protein FlgD
VRVPDRAAQLTVRVWDRFGEEVRLLADERPPAAGDRELIWDGADDTGRIRPPGEFIVRVTVDDRSESRILRVTA